MPGIVYSPLFLEHETRFHPENKERLLAIVSFLEKKGYKSRDFIEPLPASEKDLLLVHTKKHLDNLKFFSMQQLSTGDNVFNKNTFEVAKLAAGSSFTASSLSMLEEKMFFSLARPPGHHAGRETFEGFCYLNNLAFAVKKMQNDGLAKKVLIVDFDLHYGNGTHEIFSGDDSVYYVSLHQDPVTLYPSRKLPIKDKTTQLIDLKQGVKDKEYIPLFGNALEEALKDFSPDLVGISAGFDLHSAGNDLMIGNALSIRKTGTFAKIGKLLRKSVSSPVFAVLEGGYYLPLLGECVYSFLSAFG